MQALDRLASKTIDARSHAWRSETDWLALNARRLAAERVATRRSGDTPGSASTPIPSISISTTSPSFIDTGGVRVVADARRRAGQDQVARLEREHVRRERDQVAHAEERSTRVAVLEELAVQALDDAQAAAVAELRHRHEPVAERAERVEALAARPLLVAVLEVPRRDVVRAAVARDEVERVVLGDRAGRGGRSRPRARPRSRRASPRAAARSPRPGRSACSRTCRRAAARPAARGRSRAMWRRSSGRCR